MRKAKLPEFPDRGGDWYRKSHAGVLASYLTEWWRAHGCFNVLFERYEIQPGLWGIKSNLVNGLPPRNG